MPIRAIPKHGDTIPLFWCQRLYDCGFVLEDNNPELTMEENWDGRGIHRFVRVVDVFDGMLPILERTIPCCRFDEMPG